MRCLIYTDLPEKTESDAEYMSFLREELPRRLKLLEGDYSGMPWSVTFADEEFGDESLSDFLKTLRHNRENYDAVIVIPDPAAVEKDMGLGAESVGRHPYMRTLAEVVQQAGDLPVLAYVDDTGPRTEFNLLTGGFAAIVNHADEPALLPLKVARAVNGLASAANVLSLGGFNIDLKSGAADVDGQNVNFSPAERAMVLTLARARGKIRGKEMILRSIAGLEDEAPEIKIIDVHMTRIRGKINEKRPGLGFDIFRTSWGDGYTMLNQLPEGRLHRGLLRLDPRPEGGYVIADTQLVITQDQFEVFEHLYGAVGRGVPTMDNFLIANRETLESLSAVLGTYLVTNGAPVLYDLEEGRTYLNPEYFDVDIFDATAFNSLLRQEIRAVGPYRFLRQGNTQMFRMAECDELFALAEVRLLEHLLHVEGQAVRAHTLFRHVRGESRYLRGERTPDEDIVDLARSLFRKLEKANASDDTRQNVHIYHNAYVSYGPAEEVPDPAQLATAQKQEVEARLVDRLAKASGSAVELETLELGYFKLKIHPTLGNAVIEGKAMSLTPRQASVIKHIHAARPAIVPLAELHEKIFPGRSYSQQRISNEMYGLRRILQGIDESWDRVVTLVRGQGYVCLQEGETLPEPEVAAKVPRAARATPAPAEPPEEVPLTGGLKLLRNARTGKSTLEGTNLGLSPNETNLLVLIASRYPETVFATEVERVLKLANAKMVFDKLAAKWSAFCPDVRFPMERAMQGRGFTWLLSPLQAKAPVNGAEADAVPASTTLEFSEPVNGARRCEALEMDFTIREAELLTLLQNRVGGVLGLDAIKAHSAMSWTDSLVLQTLEYVQKKIATRDPDFARRLEYSKRKGTMQLNPPVKTLPAARVRVA